MKKFLKRNIYKKILSYILIVSFLFFILFPLEYMSAQNNKDMFGLENSENNEDVLISQNITYLSPNIIFELDNEVEKDTEEIVFKEKSFSIPNKVVIDFKDPKKEDKYNKGNKIEYIVKKGDTIGRIAENFEVTISTIKIENKLTNNNLREGQKIYILPASGFTYTIKKGDTVSKITKRFDSNEEKIRLFNNKLKSTKDTDVILKVGEDIFIPVENYYKKIATPKAKIINKKSTYRKNTKTHTKKKAIIKKSSVRHTRVKSSGYFTNPAPGSVKTQGIHGRNAVDLASIGGKHIPIVAAASGKVTRARRVSGWYGGYGMNILIAHSNGTQTLYAHLSKVVVSAGQYVRRGQVIGYMGTTGRSTGVHLHFEVRGGVNPF